MQGEWVTETSQFSIIYYYRIYLENIAENQDGIITLFSQVLRLISMLSTGNCNYRFTENA